MAWVLGLVGLGVLFVAGPVGLIPEVHSQRGAELGTVILENDKVAVRRYMLLPGMSTGMHSHDRDYVLVVLQGGSVDITTLPPGTTQTEQIETGTVAW